MKQTSLFKGRDLRKKEFFMVDDQYLNGYARVLGPAVSVVYLALCRHVDKNQEAFPAIQLVAEKVGLSERHVRRAIKVLQGANMVGIEKVRTSSGKFLNNLYTMIDRSLWTKPEDIHVLWKARGHLAHKPEATRVRLRKHIESQKILKETHTASPSGNGSALEVFDLKAEIKKLKDSPQRHIQLIGEFLEEKDIHLETKAQLKRAIARHLKAARALADFSDKQIGEATRVAMREYPAYTLETLVKVLTR